MAQTTVQPGRKHRGNYREHAKRLFLTVASPLYSGEGVRCPCCEREFRAFLPPGGRTRSRCPGCGALKRHRLLLLYLRDRTNFFSAPLRVLHFAPEPMLQARFQAMPNLDYVSTDLYSEHAMVRADITDLPFPNDEFDAILCLHVLEHIPDDRLALSELFRVLKPGGWAILQPPVNENLEQTREDPSIVTPAARLRAFGQSDHVRVYGRDYPQRVRDAGFAVMVDDYAARLEPEQLRRYGVSATEKVYRCERPRAAHEGS